MTTTRPALPRLIDGSSVSSSDDSSKNTDTLDKTTSVRPRADAVAPKYQRKRHISDVEDSGEEDECKLGTRLMDPGHRSEIHDSEMTVGSTRRVDGGGGLLELPQRCPVR